MSRHASTIDPPEVRGRGRTWAHLHLPRLQAAIAAGYQDGLGQDVCKPGDLKVGDRVEKATVEHVMYANSRGDDFSETEAKKGAKGTVTAFSPFDGGGVHVDWDRGTGAYGSSVIAPQNLYKIS